MPGPRSTAVADEALRLDDKYPAPQAVNPERANRDMDLARAEARGDVGVTPKGVFPLSAYHTGKFIEADGAKDDYYRAQEDVVRATGNRFGMHMAPPGLPQYWMDKKKDELYMNVLRFGEYLVDEKDPRTQDNLYSIFPELKEKPDQYYRDEIALQWALHNLLKAGQIKTKNDHMLVSLICRPHFEIPVYPAWDPTGIFMKGTTAFNKLVTLGMKRGLLNPMRFADGPDKREEVGIAGSITQQELKRMIVRRLYPGLRDKDNAEIDAALQRTVQAGIADGTIHRLPMEDGFDWQWKQTALAPNLNPFNDTSRQNATFDRQSINNGGAYNPVDTRNRGPLPYGGV